MPTLLVERRGAQDTHRLGKPLRREMPTVSQVPQVLGYRWRDNVAGICTTAGGDVHGGNDDNFYVTRNSPAIDRGHTWQGVPTDIDGLPRSDDPGTVNTGTPRYIQTSPQPNFILSGTAQNWRPTVEYGC